MATLPMLCAGGSLIRMGGGLGPDELPQRLLYAYPHVITWLDDVLPTIDPMPDSAMSPTAQVDDLFHDFVSGEDFGYYRRSHRMMPVEQGIWELKSDDIRIFGWFYAKCTFIIANINSMERIKTIGLYAGYLGDCVRRRETLALDPPKFLLGSYSDVL